MDITEIMHQEIIKASFKLKKMKRHEFFLQRISIFFHTFSQRNGALSICTNLSLDGFIKTERKMILKTTQEMKNDRVHYFNILINVLFHF